MSGDTRHLDDAALKSYLTSPVPLAQAIAGPVEVRLLYDPDGSVLGVDLAWDGVAVDLDGWAHLSGPVVLRDGQARQQLWVHGEERLVAGYALLRAVADRVQLHGEPSSDAIVSSVAAMGELLERAPRLSPEREVGLFGELLVLEHLLPALGAPAALASWKGALREEHDFGLADGDVEVKTTLGEDRRHWMHGKEQLTPSHGVVLYLLSIQITDGGVNGRTLAELVAAVRAGLTAELARQFGERLTAQGWHDDQAHRYVKRLRLRSVPVVYRVTADFPRLDDAALLRAGLDGYSIPDLNYLLDLGRRRPSSTGPAALLDLLETGPTS